MIEADFVDRTQEDILSYFPTGILTTDNRMRITYFNKHFASLHHIEKNKTVTDAELDSFLPLEFSIRQLLKKLLKGEIDKVEAIYNISPAEKSPTIKMAAILMKDEAGLSKGILIFCEDISELKSLNKELIHSSKMAAIGEMASMFAHEMRNPITGINLAAEVLKIKCANDKSILETVSDIEITTRKIEEIINRIMEFARIDIVSFSKNSIEDLVKSSLELTSSYLNEYNVSPSVRIKSGTPSIYLDETQLIQVLVHLIKNACKAMKHNGGGLLEIILDQRGDWVQIHFKDQGKGMDDEEMQRAFRPFCSNFTEGTGLGLCIAKRIVELHQGRIIIESRKNAGSTVTVELPLQIKSE